MPKITKHPKLRTAIRKNKAGKATPYYYFDMRGSGEKDIPLGSDWAVALAKWEVLRSGHPLPPVAATSTGPYNDSPNFAALAGMEDDDEDDSIESLLILPTVQVIPAGERPDGDGCGVYALFNERGGLLYIGESFDVGARIVQHRNAALRGERQTFANYGFVPVPQLMLLGVETAHIYALKPPENRKYAAPLWECHVEAVKVLRDAWGEKR